MCMASTEDHISLSKLQIRWFHQDVKTKQWLPFSGSDSFDLETAYQIHIAQADISIMKSLEHNDAASANTVGSDSEKSSNHKSLVSVLDGLFDVDLQNLTCFPVYWKDTNYPIAVLRGTWFRLTKKGVREPIDDQSMVNILEETYSLLCQSTNPTEAVDNRDDDVTGRLQVIQSAPVLDECLSSPIKADRSHSTSLTQPPEPIPKTAKTKVKSPLSTINFTDSHVDFFSLDEIYIYHDSTSLYIRKKLGMQKVGTRLYRGYGVDADDADRNPPITHLCFVVHGIGQKMGLRPILKSVDNFREVCKQIQNKYFMDPIHANQRVEFLPIDWRCSLQLACDTIDSITPYHVRRVRHTLNSSAMDIMYYTSPVYRTEIAAGLSQELNLVYSKFCSRHPNFESIDGKVSIIAHSLGCVLIYDLITGWNQPLFHCSPGTTDHQHDAASEHARIPKLESTLENSDILSPEVLQNLSRLSTKLETIRSQAHHVECEISHLLDSPAVLTSGSKRQSLGLLPTAQFDTTCAGEPNYPLHFLSRLQNLFCLGSPLGVYLVLRGIRPGAYVTQDNILPRRICTRLFNIYHPSDPVAYRLEPLLLQHYATVEPVVLRAAEAAYNLDYDQLPLVPSSSSTNLDNQNGPQNGNHHENNELVTENRTSPNDSINSIEDQSSSDEQTYNTAQSIPSPPKGTLIKVLAKYIRSASAGPEKLQPTKSTDSSAEQTPNSLSGRQSAIVTSMDGSESSVLSTDEQLSRLQLEHRIDYQLRTARYENMYLSMVTSHVSYWSNADMAMLILTQLFHS